MEKWGIYGATITVGLFSVYYLYQRYNTDNQPTSKSSSTNNNASLFSTSSSPTDIQQRNALKTEKDLRCFTLSELSRYDGKNSKEIYVSVNGIVYDVTNSGFYGPNEAYEQFSGHDVSINLAEMTLDEKSMDIMDLSHQSEQTKNDVISRGEYYDGKYERIGYLKEWIPIHH
jgi:membrane-associated progesterone receptor component